MGYQRLVELDRNIRLSFESIQENASWELCRLDGFLDNQNTPKMLEHIRTVLHENKVVFGLDLSGLSYISSTGVGALSSLTLESRGTGKFFFLTGIPERVQKVFLLLGVSDLFSVISNPEVYPFRKHLL